MTCPCGSADCDCTRNCFCNRFLCNCLECNRIRRLDDIRRLLERESQPGTTNVKENEVPPAEVPQEEEPLMFPIDDIDSSTESTPSSNSVSNETPRPKLTNPLYLNPHFRLPQPASLNPTGVQASTSQPSALATRSREKVLTGNAGNLDQTSDSPGAASNSSTSSSSYECIPEPSSRAIFSASAPLPQKVDFQCSPSCVTSVLHQSSATHTHQPQRQHAGMPPSRTSSEESSVKSNELGSSEQSVGSSSVDYEGDDASPEQSTDGSSVDNGDASSSEHISTIPPEKPDSK